MQDNKQLEDDMKILQENLLLVRKTAKWTTQQLGDLVGLSKVTISNIENKKYPLTKIQYIALRAVIDYEINNNQNKKLDTVINLIYNTDGMNEEDRQKALAFISGTSNINMDDKTFKAGLCALVGVTVGIIGVASLWLSRAFKK